MEMHGQGFKINLKFLSVESFVCFEERLPSFRRSYKACMQTATVLDKTLIVYGLWTPNQIEKTSLTEVLRCMFICRRTFSNYK